MKLKITEVGWGQPGWKRHFLPHSYRHTHIVTHIVLIWSQSRLTCAPARDATLEVWIFICDQSASIIWFSLSSFPDFFFFLLSFTKWMPKDNIYHLSANFVNDSNNCSHKLTFAGQKASRSRFSGFTHRVEMGVVKCVLNRPAVVRFKKHCQCQCH